MDVYGVEGQWRVVVMEFGISASAAVRLYIRVVGMVMEKMNSRTRKDGPSLMKKSFLLYFIVHTLIINSTMKREIPRIPLSQFHAMLSVLIRQIHSATLIGRRTSIHGIKTSSPSSSRFVVSSGWRTNIIPTVDILPTVEAIA
jgi:hypothetical protein